MGIGRLRRGIDSFPCEGQTGSHSGPEVRLWKASAYPTIEQE
jgi:hypothetical protein